MPAHAAGAVRVIRVEGSIDPATASYVLRGLRAARENGDALLLIELDTPGGLVDSTKDIIKGMLASPVPVAVYVSPEGAMAASAGTYITVAAQVAAMAPTTHIGSATPIAGEGKDLPRKVTNAMASYMETLAQRRGRNAKWAVKAVREGISATETQALKLHVIDLVATSRQQLLQKIDGRSVEVAGGRKITLKTARAPVEELPINPRESLLHFLANPFVVGVLVLVAMYGIIAELSNPGAIFPGVIGGIALILVLFSSNVLPISYTALLLIVFSFILLAVDAYVPTHGVLTTGGVAALALGLFLLIDTDEPMFRMSLSFVITAAVVSGLLFTTAIGAGIRAQKRKVTTGHEGLIGQTAEARTAIAPVGRVFLEGAWWTAETEGEPIEAGRRVRVVDVRGLRLFVTPE